MRDQIKCEILTHGDSKSTYFVTLVIGIRKNLLVQWNFFFSQKLAIFSMCMHVIANPYLLDSDLTLAIHLCTLISYTYRILVMVIESSSTLDLKKSNNLTQTTCFFPLKLFFSLLSDHSDQFWNSEQKFRNFRFIC